MSFLSSVLSSFSQYFFFVSYPVTKSSFCGVQVIIVFKENFLTSLFFKSTDTRTHVPCFLLSGQRPTGATFEFLGTVFLCARVCLCGSVWFCVAPRVPETPAAAFATPGCSSVVAPILWCAGKDPLLPLTIRSLNFFSSRSS